MCTFSDLLDSFGAADSSKTKKQLSRADSHVSNDVVVYRKDEVRNKHILAVKELLGVITGGDIFSDIIQQSVLYETIWPKLPQSENAAKNIDPDSLMQSVEDLDRERSTLSKLSTLLSKPHSETMRVDEQVKQYLTRCQILNSYVSNRLAKKYCDQSDQTIRTSPLNKQDAPVPRSEVILFWHTLLNTRLNTLARHQTRDGKFRRGEKIRCLLHPSTGTGRFEIV